MSGNPETFEFLRQVAYSFVKKNGKDGDRLRVHLEEAFEAWRRETPVELERCDADIIIQDIVRWCLTNYRPPGRSAPVTPRHHQRAGQRIVVGTYKGLIREGRDASIDAIVNEMAGVVSRSSANRALIADELDPKRTAKKAKLSPSVRRIVEILEHVLTRADGRCLIDTAEFASALTKGPANSASTRSMRTRRLKEALETIQRARLGFHFAYIDQYVAVSRGRRWSHARGLEKWYTSALQRGRVTRISRVVDAVTAEARRGPFWGSDEAQNIVSLLRISINNLDWPSLFRLALILGGFADPTIPVRLVWKAAEADCLWSALDRAEEAGVCRNSLAKLIRAISDLQDAAADTATNADLMRVVLLVTGYQQHIERIFHDADERLRRVRILTRMVSDSEDLYASLDHFERLGAEEAEGRWKLSDFTSLYPPHVFEEPNVLRWRKGFYPGFPI